ncbi:hypothetical protein THASP1DRAFT_32045 [Thamnocephalis sphaerospora]|uniref:Glutamine amidotransferase type-2 domain-containing protein n=1 Tax=Thamnocephalis sphaerospora TaxID=78915 RepID=A0A4P9XK14_9FUNG|nr:hypothetical protein THASP1DRAFT_32045 [Thamnocephalis sphaerospora]|eukprot:RKP06133.1 hypothetical protein THASP1DRAFT_32045 [Thamnocephalis sphaerospora]
MCGIALDLLVGAPAAVCAAAACHADEWQALARENARRGPDAAGEHIVQLNGDGHPSVALRFFGATLHLRGDRVTQQPLVDQHGNVLCWNGEVFAGLEIGENNDAVCLQHALEHAVDAGHTVLSVLNAIRGPFAMIYYEAARQRLWFGRDCLGRRSLLWKSTSDAGVLRLTLSSTVLPSLVANDGLLVGEGENEDPVLPTTAGTITSEVPASGICCLDLGQLLRTARSDGVIDGGLVHALDVHTWSFDHAEAVDVAPSSLLKTF